MAKQQLVFLCAFLAASMVPMCTMARRISDSRVEQIFDTSELAAPDDSDDPRGVAHMTLKVTRSFFGKDLAKTAPGEVTYMLKSKGLLNDFVRMTKSIQETKRGRTGAWKSSAILRVLYEHGFEKKFAEQKVSLYLVKKDEGHATSVLKLYFVDEKMQPGWAPNGIYRDAGSVLFINDRVKGDDNVFMSMKSDFFALQIWADRRIPFLREDIPVEVLKLLDAKGALEVFSAFARTANDYGPKAKNVEFALAVRKHRKAFVEKGIFVSLSTVHTDSPVYDNDLTWITLADFDAYNAKYGKKDIETMSVAHQYDEKIAVAYQECKAGDAAAHTKHVWALTGFDVLTQRSGKSCGGVHGAEPREGESGCKCPTGESIFCGNKEALAERKFASSFSLWEKKATAQCTQPWHCKDTPPSDFMIKSSTLGMPFKVRVETNMFKGDKVAVTFDGVTKMVPLLENARRDTDAQVFVPEWDCRHYRNHTSQCGLFDTKTFEAKKACCACKGGDIVGDYKIAYCAQDTCMLPGKREP